MSDAQLPTMALCDARSGQLLAWLEPTPQTPIAEPPEAALSSPHRLSRFFYMRLIGDSWRLSSPTGHHAIMVQDASLLADLKSIVDGRKHKDHDVAFRRMLLAARLMWPVNSHGVTTEDDDQSLTAWTFHDLLLHTATRNWQGPLVPTPTGLAPPPAMVQRPSLGPLLSLPSADLTKASHEEMPFATLVESRRSLRTYGREPLSLRQLAEFLYRVARVTSTGHVAASAESAPITMVRRPYPSGGALYELEVYIAVRRCQGLEPGIYFYAAGEHGLRLVAPWDAKVEKVMDRAADAAAVERGALQTQLILTSRYPRLAWKYGPLSYTLTLKHVGVLMESMALTAAAMHLAGCPIGNGMSQDFAAAAGLKGMAEVAVGEFLLGSAVE